jgi:hypothetical protein
MVRVAGGYEGERGASDTGDQRVSKLQSYSANPYWVNIYRCKITGRQIHGIQFSSRDKAIAAAQNAKINGQRRDMLIGRIKVTLKEYGVARALAGRHM